MDFDFPPSGEESGKPHKKKKKKKSKGSDEDTGFGSTWTDVENTTPSFDTGFDGGSSMVQPEAESRTSRRVSFSDDPPESHTFNKPDADTGAGVGPWQDEMPVPAMPDMVQTQQELCWRCGKGFELTDSLFCRHCGCKRGSASEASIAPSSFSTPGGLIGFGESEPGQRLERRFSFSLTDMTDARQGLVGSPYLPGSEPIRESLELQKWNPLDGVKRHWRPSAEEIGQGQLGYMVSESGSFPKPTSFNSGEFSDQVHRAQQRLSGLQQKISHLESSLNPESWPAGGCVELSIAQLAQDGGLGVVLQGLAVAGISDANAVHVGWAVGDQILQVNGVTVINQQQLSQELAKAISAHRAVMRPISIQVWRHDSANAARQMPQNPWTTSHLPSSEPVSHQVWAGPKLVSHSASVPALPPSFSRPRRRVSLC
ncbi:unnamed protein product [Symbiodinium pilosum]|uniref:PDZ domain-containing protein n=1 Tax=Symbiodinium pilosum TaxID=2952 RepID=A0A812LFV4_SYMPI|nr:unnamed protein product [Symbiodinium pilosum]